MWQFIKIGAIVFTALINLFLGFLVLVRNPKNKINLIFFLVGLFFCFWTLCLLFYEFPFLFPSIFWIKACYFVVSFLVFFIWIFSFVFPTVVFRKLWYAIISLGLLFISFSFWLLYISKFWIIGVVIDPQKGLQTLWGPGYVWWLFIIWGIFIWALVNFIYNSRRSTGAQKMQLRYLFYGFGIWSVFLNTADVMIPIFFNDTRYFSLSPISSLFFTGAVAYSILRHRLLDIRLVVARTLSYSLLLIIITSFYVFSLFSIGAVFYETQINVDQIIVNAVLTILVAFTFQPLRRFLEKITDRIFFKDQYNTEELLSSLTKILSSTLILKNLINIVLGKILKEVKINQGIIALIEQSRIKDVYQINGDKQKLINEDIAVLMQSAVQPLIFDELPEGKRKGILRKYQCLFAQALKVKERILGLLLLGGKLSGEIYSVQDIELLSIFAPQLAVAMENALAYRKIQKFSETLKLEVEKATQDLQHANKRLKEVSALKDEFVSLTSHELRTPLTAIGGSLSTVLDGFAGKLSTETKEFLQGAYNENSRLLRLVNNLLNISRIESKRLKFSITAFDFGKVIESAIESLKTQAQEKKLSLLVDCPEKMLVEADEDKVREIVVNLVGNAIKFTESGGVSLTGWQDGELAVVAVEDTGRGILPHDQAKLFCKFEQVDGLQPGQKKGGTGLGLYICKNLAEGMNGTVWLASEHGKGSTFFATLPIAKQ